MNIGRAHAPQAQDCPALAGEPAAFPQTAQVMLINEQPKVEGATQDQQTPCNGGCGGDAKRCLVPFRFVRGAPGCLHPRPTVVESALRIAEPACPSKALEFACPCKSDSVTCANQLPLCVFLMQVCMNTT